MMFAWMVFEKKQGVFKKYIDKNRYNYAQKTSSFG